jgi:hypothetical protein
MLTSVNERRKQDIKKIGCIQITSLLSPRCGHLIHFLIHLSDRYLKNKTESDI